MVLPTFFNLSLDFAIRSSWSEPQSVLGLVFADCREIVQFNSEFCNKEWMIWCTVSSRPYFCCLYRASTLSAAKNMINLISVLTIWWCPCIESSLVLLEEGVCWPVCSLGKTLLAFAPLHFVLQSQPYLLLQVSLDFLLLHSCPLRWNGHLFLSK